MMDGAADQRGLMWMHTSWTVPVSIFFVGLLAGEEFAIRFGIRGPLARLDPRAHIEMRQGLIRTLRVLVPILFALSMLSGIAATIAGWQGSPGTLRLCSVVLLVAFIIVTLTGTVPINKAADGWDASNPPPGWQEAMRRWERLDTIRTALALGAFALAVIGAFV
jgi:uncharacterized membrane protein